MRRSTLTDLRKRVKKDEYVSFLPAVGGLLGGLVMIAAGRLLQKVDDALADLGGED